MPSNLTKTTEINSYTLPNHFSSNLVIPPIQKSPPLCHYLSCQISLYLLFYHNTLLSTSFDYEFQKTASRTQYKFFHNFAEIQFFPYFLLLTHLGVSASSRQRAKGIRSTLGVLPRVLLNVIASN